MATQRWARETSRRQDSTSKQLILHTSISTASVRWINFSLVQQHLGLVLHPVVDGVGVGLHQALGHHPGPELVAEQLVGDQDLGGNCKHQGESSSANVIFAAQLRAALTVDVEADPLADCGRDVVAGDAEVGAHLRPAHPRQAQVLPLVLGEPRPAADSNHQYSDDVRNAQ